MRKVLLVGAVGCGKTTFRQQLHGEETSYRKTQAMEAVAGVIDTPGEYLELGRLKRALMIASYNVDTVVLLAAADCEETRFPPGFATTFNRDVVGIITKIDIATPDQVECARRQLELAGADRIMLVDSVSGTGFDQVRERLCETSS